MTGRRTVTAIVCVFGTLLASNSASAQARRSLGYEVWIVDQSDTRGLNHGGTVYIFAGRDLPGRDATPPRPAATIDLGADTAALCRERTGANPVRPHMILFNREHTHAILAFVASGHVAIFDARTRVPLACLRTTEAPTGRQAHSAFPSPDGSYILVANQNGKRLERIDANFATNTFSHNQQATLDLATCRTPAGMPCQSPQLRPDNAPICPVISSTGDLAFVTLRGGGLLVVDPRATPIRIVAEYDMATVKGNGCGGAEVSGQMFVNSGGRPGVMEHLHLYGFDVYRFPLSAFFRAPAASAFEPNAPAPAVVFQADGQRDSHGMVVAGRGDYLWVFDRHADVAEVLRASDGRHLRTVPLNGALTNNARPGSGGQRSGGHVGVRGASRSDAAQRRSAQRDRQHARPRHHPADRGRQEWTPCRHRAPDERRRRRGGRADPHGLRVRRVN